MLFGDIVEVPLEVAVALSFAQASVLAVAGFEPGEVAFKTVGRSRDEMIIEVVEHIRQCPHQHTPGPLDVAEDIPDLGPIVYLGTVLLLPVCDELEELVPVCFSANPGHLEEDISELSSVGSLGDIAAPDQPLALDMDQTALHGHTRPKAPEYVCQVGVAINSEAAGAQAPLYQRFQEYPELSPRTLGDSVFAGDECMCLRIHQRDKATGTVDKRPVQDQVLGLPQRQDGLRRYLRQIVVDHTVELSRAVPALTGQLSDRVAFDDPTPEPLLFIGVPGLGIAPTERAPTPEAVPPLPAVGVMAVSPGNTGTSRAVFF